MIRTAQFVAALGMALLGSIACGSGSGAPNSIAGGLSDTNSQLVAVTLGEFSVKADSPGAAAGKITFAVKNAGAVKHELVVLQASAPDLAVDSSTNKAVEDTSGVKHIGEIDGLDAGGTKALTLNLSPGTYFLICNIPGHYHLGMATKIEVH